MFKSVEAIDTVDLTERATAGGWALPDGWTVQADMVLDDSIGAVDTEYDCYSERQVDAWLRDDWVMVVVSVFVMDASGRDWGRSVIGGFEYGNVPGYEDDSPSYDLNPLEDKPGEWSPIREHDMIGEALRDAVKTLEAFGTPVLSEPAGITVTGL